MNRLGDFSGHFEPSPLTASWPLSESGSRFDLGRDFEWPDAVEFRPSVNHDALAAEGIGLWDCDLSDNQLTWSDGVYELFGLPRDLTLYRETAVSLYEEGSRSAMERLRAYAIRHRRGFSLDVEIRPANGGVRWLRLVGAPICVKSRPVRLRGLKWDVTQLYC
jgi:PAS domain-containing protein